MTDSSNAGSRAYELTAGHTLVPDSERCQERVTVGEAELQCGCKAGHSNVHLANLIGHAMTVDVGALLQWVVEDNRE